MEERMSNGGQPISRFRIESRENKDLGKFGSWPWEFFALANLAIQAPSGPGKLSGRLPFRLDTCAFASVIPERWLTEMRLRRFLPSLSTSTIKFDTAAGQGEGQLARDVPIVFSDNPNSAYLIDFVVTKGLNNQKTGLIALRDIIRYFDLHTVGPFPVRKFRRAQSPSRSDSAAPDRIAADPLSLPGTTLPGRGLGPARLQTDMRRP
jgi:hypothetical protein